MMPEYIKRSDVINAIMNSDLLVGNNAEWAIEIVKNIPTIEIKTEEGES